MSEVVERGTVASFCSVPLVDNRPVAEDRPVETVEQAAAKLIEKADKARALSVKLERVAGYAVEDTRIDNGRRVFVLKLPEGCSVHSEADLVAEVVAAGINAVRYRLMRELGELLK